MSDSGVEPSVSNLFEQLREVVAGLNVGGKVPSAAAVKSALLAQYPGFDEQAVGFRKFVDFLTAASDAGVVGMMRDVNNHPRVYPATADGTRVQAIVRASIPLAGRGVKLRREVWRALVDWDPLDYWRGWDRQNDRVFMAPQLGAIPPWDADDTRFVALPVVSQELQVEWMRAFAAAQEPASADVLLLALAPDAELGAFKEQLDAHELGDAWAADLQRNVNTHAANWATAANVARRHLFAAPSKTAERTNPGRARNDIKAAGDSGAPELTMAAQNGIVPWAALGGEESLRRALHAVLDGMTVAEMSALMVPARFLTH